jgi:hypothetical protein
LSLLSRDVYNKKAAQQTCHRGMEMKAERVE